MFLKRSDREAPSEAQSFGPDEVYSNPSKAASSKNTSQQCGHSCKITTISILIPVIIVAILIMVCYILWRRRKVSKDDLKVQDAVRTKLERLGSKETLREDWESVSTLKAGSTAGERVTIKQVEGSVNGEVTKPTDAGYEKGRDHNV
ncbi:uncharacterized protein KY384_004351 [Bacidia gigantensis]|uniref:uncharacterized protein n=1 Tax=Bacidia gigantensis TaxID=2732470 RepID=UPI001D053688|nr:uncharacterized protein KY384_004351 [Bacidia gigantensis]KAG8530994.1 hypothetical protein KY384_004351 [Bacidia gigantensis]